MRRPTSLPTPQLLVRSMLFITLLLALLTTVTHASAADGPQSSSSSDSGAPPPSPKNARRQLPAISVERLRKFDGTNESMPLLVALDRRVYDVSTKRDVYGPGGGYATFSGRDSTRNFALYSTEAKDDGSCIEDLEEKDFKMLAEWRRWFDEPYPLVAVITEKLCQSDDSPEVTARRGFARPAAARSSEQQQQEQQKPLAVP